MFFLCFEVTPSAEHPEKDELGGAFVNCWIDCQTLEEAISEAHEYFVECHFIADQPDEAYETSREDYEDPRDLECFDEAVGSDGVFVFHEYPIVDEEDGE